MVLIFYLLFVTCLCINISFWLFLFSRLCFHKSKKTTTHQDITILVVFKNASQFIQSCISGLLSQNDVPEILLVNDFSDDTSAEYVESIQTKTLKLYHAKENQPGKKSALHEGLRQVETELVLVTDVDCQATSPYWAQHMASHFTDQIDIVLGYSPVKPAQSFLNRFIRFETWMTAVQYMSYAIAKMTYMGVGRNLAYRKSIAQDFKPDLSVLSGDDDLLISATATANNTALCLDPKSFVFTEGKDSYTEFYRQKRRHMTTSLHYKVIHKLLLSLFSISQMFVLPLCFILLFISNNQRHTILVFSLYMLLKWMIAFPLLRRFKEDNLFFLFPILDICFSVYYWIMSLTIFVPMKTWN